MQSAGHFACLSNHFYHFVHSLCYRIFSELSNSAGTRISSGPAALSHAGFIDFIVFFYFLSGGGGFQVTTHPRLFLTFVPRSKYRFSQYSLQRFDLWVFDRSMYAHHCLSRLTSFTVGHACFVNLFTVANMPFESLISFLVLLDHLLTYCLQVVTFVPAYSELRQSPLLILIRVPRAAAILLDQSECLGVGGDPWLLWSRAFHTQRFSDGFEYRHLQLLP